MNKIFKSNSIVRKSIILLIIFVTFLTIFPATVNAEDGKDEDWMSKIAGSMADVVGKFIRGLGDGIISIMQENLMPGSPPAITYTNLLQAYIEVLKTSEDPNDQALVKELEKEENQAVFKDPVGYAKHSGTNGLIQKVKDNMKFRMSNDGKNIWGEDDINGFAQLIANERLVSVILYTPRAIFSNIVPAFDVNFLNPRVKVGNIEMDYEYKVSGNSEDNWNFSVQPIIKVNDSTRN